ncbi:MAG TPA: 2-phosphosulfolactate phosphatase [Ktedonobacterales bacterium]|nr:2-phosphosulfolactate phosphatase [Ktedonobacterales bacterium]
MQTPLQPPTTQARALTVDVALDPAAIAIAGASSSRHATTFIVVDVVRATTTLAVFFERGCSRVLVASSIATAREARRALGPSYLLAGEEEGARPPGFDLGNSPAEAATSALRGRQIIFATTNGTRALRACEGGRAVLAGALRSARAVGALAYLLATSGHGRAGNNRPRDAGSVAPTEAATLEAHPDVYIVCAGRDGRAADDDTLCAGYLTRTIIERAEAIGGSPIALGDGAHIALAVVEEAERSGPLRTALATSAAARSLERIGLTADLDWCAATDATDLVPRVVAVDRQHDLLVVEAPPPELPGS